jgi:hypothetical protein
MGRAAWQIAGAALLALLGGVRLAGQKRSIDPYSLPMVQAACGAEGSTPPPAMSGGHVMASALKPGMARVYVISETRALFGSRGQTVRLGMDGRWFGANRSYTYGYSCVDVSPGVHHLCVASKVRGVLPHTAAAVTLARVDAAAGQTYYFYNRCTWLVGLLTLQPMSAEDGAMYLQALPSSNIPKLWKTAAAQAACGADPNQMPSDPVPRPNLPGPPAAGKALVYFFSGVPRFGSHKLSDLLFPGPQSGGFLTPIHVGVDGNWVGETQARSYLGVQIASGVHRLCSATKLIPGMKPTLLLGQLDLAAGETYFVDTNTLQPVEYGLATVWLRRIAAMPKSDKPDLKALKQWSRTNFPDSPDELRACGIPSADSKAAAPSRASSMAPLMGGAPPASQVFFLLKSDIKWLHRLNAVNVGLDGHWAASLRSTSWASLPVAAGQHNVCVHICSGPRRRDQWFSADSTLFLDSFDARDGKSIYFESQLVIGDFALFGSSRLDPDEGALLVAYCPRADKLHP